MVEDDEATVEILAFALRRAGFESLHASTIPAARQVLAEAKPDIALLDVHLGPENGFELLREIRRQSSMPVIMLTAEDEESAKIRGLGQGADDYVTKPFSYPELVARIAAVLRRAAPSTAAAAMPSGELRAGSLTLNAATHSATKNGEPVKLTPSEFRLLQCLLARSGTVVEQRAVLREVWGPEYLYDGQLLRPLVHRLRKKLEDDPDHPRLVRTVPGVGLMLCPPEVDGPVD